MSSINLRKAVTWTLIGALAAFGSAIGAGGPPVGKGPPEGGGKPPVESSNNLAYPSADGRIASGGYTYAAFSIDFESASLGDNFSWGCEAPAGSEYPNYSCANDLGTVFYLPDSPQCVALCPGGADRMFWQKVSGNTWTADTFALNDIPPDVAFVDWGDALESRTSAATSVVRVETMPFYDSIVPNYTGYVMWHAYGLGKTEMWGVRVDSSNTPVSYSNQFAILRPDGVQLSISKLAEEAEPCPTSGVEGGSSPYDGVGEDPTMTWTGNGWDDAFYNHPMLAFTAELNIGGKYVYGYNWMLKTFAQSLDNKAGWWRLTFVTDKINFTDDTKIGPPVVPEPVITAEEGESSYPLYVPVIDTANNLTFIDVCLSSNKGGGSKGRKPTSPGE